MQVFQVLLHQSKCFKLCCKAFSKLWYDTSYRQLCVQSPLSSPLHHLLHRCLSSAYLSPSIHHLLFMCWHFILNRPSSCCIFRAIMECRVTILRKWLPCLAARVFPCEDCLICLLAPFLAHLGIWNSFIHKDVGSFSRWFSSMRCHLHQESCCSRCNSLS